MGYRIIYYIIILDKSKPLRFIDSNNRNYVIFIEYICKDESIRSGFARTRASLLVCELRS